MREEAKGRENAEGLGLSTQSLEHIEESWEYDDLILVADQSGMNSKWQLSDESSSKHLWFSKNDVSD